MKRIFFLILHLNVCASEVVPKSPSAACPSPAITPNSKVSEGIRNRNLADVKTIAHQVHVAAGKHYALPKVASPQLEPREIELLANPGVPKQVILSKMTDKNRPQFLAHIEKNGRLKGTVNNIYYKLRAREMGIRLGRTDAPCVPATQTDEQIIKDVINGIVFSIASKEVSNPAGLTISVTNPMAEKGIPVSPVIDSKADKSPIVSSPDTNTLAYRYLIAQKKKSPKSARALASSPYSSIGSKTPLSRTPKIKLNLRRIVKVKHVCKQLQKQAKSAPIMHWPKRNKTLQQ